MKTSPRAPLFPQESSPFSFPYFCLLCYRFIFLHICLSSFIYCRLVFSHLITQSSFVYHNLRKSILFVQNSIFIALWLLVVFSRLCFFVLLLCFWYILGLSSYLLILYLLFWTYWSVVNMNFYVENLCVPLLKPTCTCNW